ncbi:MAG: hypothetical protein JST62_05555 [Bacteroidetes bacterium]|nr:hypothetical protein [Bacteroidota bacterium]
MNVSEIYLGHILFAFHYTKAQYTATCTEAIPFNPFDKVICKLLKVENSLSLEEIGDILGMNVNPNKILDLAEKEILTEALQSLSSSEFGRMIDGGDINFSSCRLTTTGREYAEKKSKFRITENKPFTIFFDHTTGNHKQAKQVFEFVDGKLSGKQFAIDLADDSTLKEIAAVQIPEIYNSERQYSFTDAVLQQQKNLFIEFPIAITFNVIENSYQYYCYDTANKNIHKSFDQWINANDKVKQSLLSELANIQTAVNTNDFSTDYSNQLSEYDMNSTVIAEKSNLLKAEFVDEQLFLSYFNEVFNPKEEIEFFLCLPLVTKNIYQSLSKIVQQTENTDSRFFFIFPNNLDEEIEQSFNQLENIANEVVNLYVIQLKVNSLFLISKTESEPHYFETISGTINRFKKGFLQRKNWDSKAEKTKQLFIEGFSDKYAIRLCNEVKTIINEDIQQTVTKEQLEELEFFELKLTPFKGNETVNETLDLIKVFKEQRVVKLEEKLNLQFDEIELQFGKIETENELDNLRKEFESIKTEIIYDTSEVFAKSEKINQAIRSRKAEFEEAKRIYSFVIDTNVFFKDPEIISKVQPKHKIIIAAKVIDELDKFKTNPQLKDIAVKSIKAISKGKNVYLAKANMKLLPVDFNKKSPDNIILSTALMYKDRSGILITDDNGLQEKAKTVEMSVMSYDNFVATFINLKN